jgi:hypothetical protein
VLRDPNVSSEGEDGDDERSDADPESDDSDTDDESSDVSIEELLTRSREAFERADSALRAGDLAGYQRWVETAAAYIAKAQKVLSESPSLDDSDAA